MKQLKKFAALAAALFTINSTITFAVSMKTGTVSPAVTAKQITAPSKKLVLGYATYYYSGDTSSYDSIKSKGSLINETATDTYTMDTSGKITGMVPYDQISISNSMNIKPLAMITNNFSGAIAKPVLESAALRQALIENILTALETNNYNGVNIDLEGIHYYDRDYFTAFMNELYSKLHPLGFMVTVAVPAKTCDDITNDWNGAYDYAKLASYSDQIVLMAYDEHYEGGTPGPIASISWVQKVVDYALSSIPKEKLLLGVAAYGYDWSSDKTKAFGVDDIYKLASTKKVTVDWDPISLSPFFNYTDDKGVQHTVWFENSISLGYKLDMVNNENIAGIAIWRLGLEDSPYWDTIRLKLNK